MQRAFLSACLSRSLHRSYKAKGVSPSFCKACVCVTNKKQRGKDLSMAKRDKRRVCERARPRSLSSYITYVCGRMKLYSKPVVFEYQIMHSGRKVLPPSVCVCFYFSNIYYAWALPRCSVSNRDVCWVRALPENIGIFALSCCYCVAFFLRPWANKREQKESALYFRRGYAGEQELWQ